MKNPALATAERALKNALSDKLTGLPEPVAADTTICKAARETVEAAAPFLLADGIAMAAREIGGNDERSRQIRNFLNDRAESLRRRAVTAAKERNAA